MSEGDQHVGAMIAGKYRIRRLIGVGGMGAVYEGQHIDLGKKVAIKVIDSSDTSPELATRFKREARAASAVESEGIVQVFDVGTDPSVGLYMVMELLQGEDLEMRLRAQPGRRLDPSVVAQVGFQVARALVKAHAARVIHRDLKPANIFLSDRDDGSLRVKVLDFGISKLLASEATAAGREGMLGLTAAGVALGTPQYMSPEQAQGLTTVDHRCDIWGLGVVLYEAVSGINAFPDMGGYQNTILNLLRTQPQPLARVAPWVPEPLARVIHDAIQHNVAARIPDCATFAGRLEEAVPEAAAGSTGPFTSMHRARLASFSSVAYLANAPPVTPASVKVPQPVRPISLGDDTQVVVRPSNPEAIYDDGDQTMLALGATNAHAPKVNVLGSAAPGGRKSSPAAERRASAPSPRPWSRPVPPTEEELSATGDPTMFQSPAWVAGPNQGPATLKTGVSFTDALPAQMRLSRQGVVGLVTAALVVVVGGGLFLIASRESPVDAAASPSVESVEPAPIVAPQAEPAPPSTGTAAVPIAPATGAALLQSMPPVSPAEKVDASAASTSAAATPTGRRP